MPGLPIAIGSYAEQKRFIQRNAAFLREYPRLNHLSKKIFLRALKSPDQREVERLRKLPEDDPAVRLSLREHDDRGAHHILPRQNGCG